MIVEIVRLPKGDAPVHIRAMWIGLHLTASDSSPLRIPIVNILTEPKSRLSKVIHRWRGRVEYWDGFVVNALDAVEVLAARAPDAAVWWQDNAPHLLDGKQSFVFDADCCQILQQDTPSDLNVKP